MIISVEKIRELVNFDDWTDAKIEMKLKAIEQTIREYTNNNFQDRDCRIQADIAAGVIKSESLIPFDVGDTIQISESRSNKGLFTVSEIAENVGYKSVYAFSRFFKIATGSSPNAYRKKYGQSLN